MKQFRMIASLLLLLLLMPLHTNAKGTFTDVPNNHWAQKEIAHLAEQRLMNGYSDGSFKPNERMNRADVAVVLASMLQLEVDSTKPIHFHDVPNHHYAKDAIVAVAQKGIIQGYNGNYSPKKHLTRGEVAAIFTRAFNLSGHSGKDFRDVASNHIFYKEIQAMAANQITAGYEGNLFKPSGTLTRAEFAVFLTRAMALTEQATPTPIPATEEGSQLELEVLKRINEIREEHGLQAFERDTKVEKIAQKKSEDMRDQNYFDHISPTYGSPFEMLEAHGISYKAAGENIAVGQRTPNEVVDAWMNSEGHRKNILNPNFTHVAVGYAEGGSYGHYWTQMFTAY